MLSLALSTLLAHVLLHSLSYCRCQIEALTGTRDIIQREQKQLTAELANLKAHLVSCTCKAHAKHAAADQAHMQLRTACPPPFSVCRLTRSKAQITFD